jgi:SAM-dependent methyltransferase
VGEPGRAAAYDGIGRGYARHRTADSRIAARLHAALGDAATVVDVGAGTGSYEPPDRRVVAVEPSAVMVAQRPPGAPPAVRAVAGALPFPDRSFDAAMAVLTVHHWERPLAGLAELDRVAARVVVLADDPDAHARHWLWQDYVPAVLPFARSGLPAAAIAQALGADRVETVPVPHDCTDGFGWAHWRRPEAYLDPDVRACISGLALVEQTDPRGVARGLDRLRADLASGAWHRRYAALLDRDTVDGGFRLVVRDG